MPRGTRSKLNSAIKSKVCKPNRSVVCAVLCAGRHVITICRGASSQLFASAPPTSDSCWVTPMLMPTSPSPPSTAAMSLVPQALPSQCISPLHPSDLLLLIQTVHNSQSLRGSEGVSPICLPYFSPKGFLYTYCSYLTEHCCLMVLTADSAIVGSYREAKDELLAELQKREILDEIETCYRQRRPSVDAALSWSAMLATIPTHLQSNPTVSLALQELPSRSNPLLHFIVRCQFAHLPQCIASAPVAPFNTVRSQRQLFRGYELLLARATNGSKTSATTTTLWIRTALALFHWQMTADEVELLCAFSPMLSLDEAQLLEQRLLKWLSKEKSEMFMS